MIDRAKSRALSPLVLALAAFASAAIGRPAAGAVAPYTVPLPIPAEITDARATIVARQADVPILPGKPTRMWTFGGTFPGPTIRRPSGEPTEVTFVNDLPDAVGEITVHNHGGHSESSEDGQPHAELIAPGGARTYRYELREDGEPERGSLQWYHDHRMDVTARNVWMGLAGMFVVDDPAEAALPLPRGSAELPLMIVDRSFDADNQLRYSFDPNGVLGDVTLVNGAPFPYATVGDRRYRLRILNASNARDYDLELSDGRALVQIGTESGLLPAPVERSHIRLGPAERADVVVDFGGALGRRIRLRNRLGTGSMTEVIEFRVDRDEQDDAIVPPTLRSTPSFDEQPAAMIRSWVLGQSADTGGPLWTINGRPFDPHRSDTAPLDPRLGTTERWLFSNVSPVDHLMHIHDVDWRIVSRAGGYPPDADARLAESGLKETFRVRPGEIVEVLSRFTDHTGAYVLHCHILEHEDRSMMARFDVEG